jgi:hypothetical protein
VILSCVQGTGRATLIADYVGYIEEMDLDDLVEFADDFVSGDGDSDRDDQ